MSATPVAADKVTPFGTKLWADGANLTYTWGVWPIGPDQYTVPPWLKIVMTDVLENTWADPATNNSDGPRYTYTTGTADVIVYWAPDNPVHMTSGWIGSADGTTTPKRIWLRSDPKTASYPDWCDHLDLRANCPDAGRAAIHETGHVSGYLNHNATGVWAESRMTSPGFPFNDTNTWDKRTLGRCDEAAMQLQYDLDNFNGVYADCFDEITSHGAVGLVTDLTENPSSSAVCSGETVAVYGRLQIHDYDSYKKLGANGLWSRVVTINRSGQPYTSATVVPGSGNNWSKSLTLTTSTTITYNYTAWYVAPSAEGLDSSPVRTFSITWVRPADC